MASLPVLPTQPTTAAPALPADDLTALLSMVAVGGALALIPVMLAGAVGLAFWLARRL